MSNLVEVYNNLEILKKEKDLEILKKEKEILELKLSYKNINHSQIPNILYLNFKSSYIDQLVTKYGQNELIQILSTPITDARKIISVKKEINNKKIENLKQEYFKLDIMSYDENMLIGEYICMRALGLKESPNSEAKQCGNCRFTDIIVITEYHINENNEEWIKCDKGWFDVNVLKASRQKELDRFKRFSENCIEGSYQYNKYITKIKLINSEYDGIKRYLGYINPIFKSEIEKISKDIQEINQNKLNLPIAGLIPLALLAFKEGSKTLLNNRLNESWIFEHGFGGCVLPTGLTVAGRRLLSSQL